MPGLLEWVAGRMGFAVEGSWSGSKRVFRQGRYRVEVEPRGQVLRLDATDEAFRLPVSRRLYGSYASTVWRSRPVPMAALAQKAKIFDDGLYAAVDLAAQDGAGSFGGKATFLRALLALVGDGTGEAPEVLFSAARLGEVDVKEPAAIQSRVDGRVQKFMDDDKQSKPIGFYTWNRALGRVFQQDRMLQSKLGRSVALERFVRTLHGAPELRTEYARLLDLFERLTNPAASRTPSLLGPLAAVDSGSPVLKELAYHFIPPSRSHEVDLLYKLPNANSENLNLMDELIAAIRSGTLDPTPAPDSGWYDYQTWSNAALLKPENLRESRFLNLSKSYRDHLEALFKGMQALARETHVKQLERGVVDTCAPAMPKPPDPPPKIRVRPSISVEPFPSVYWRRALGYRFVKRILKEFFGDDALKKSMRRLTVSGRVRRRLGDEIDDVCGLFNGAARCACRDLGLKKTLPEDVAEIAERLEIEELGSGRGADQDERAFMKWNPRRDPDLSRDVRMMVPVYEDRATDRSKVWAFLGWRKVPVKVSFSSAPRVKVYDGAGSEIDRIELELLDNGHCLPQPVFAEVWVNRIMNRRQFRRFCNWHCTEEKILKALRAPPENVVVGG